MRFALVLAAWSVLGSGAHAEQHFAFAVVGARLHVETANGKIAVTTGRAGSAIDVTAIERADTAEQVKALRVATSRRGNDVTLRGVYPSNCGGSCGGEISFTIVAPPGTLLDLRTSNGNVSAAGIGADAALVTRNGSVSAAYATLTGVKRIALTTTNGNVSLELPPSAKIGHLRADTSLGHITSAWPVPVDRSSLVGASVDRTLVPGGPSVNLTTTNGSISVTKS